MVKDVDKLVSAGIRIISHLGAFSIKIGHTTEDAVNQPKVERRSLQRLQLPEGMPKNKH